MVYKAFGLNLVTKYPITGENIMQIKKDHCNPIFFFLPIVSETINESVYHAIKINIIIYSFMLLF